MQFSVVEVQEVDVLLDRSAARIKGEVQPEGHEIVARLSWSMCSTGGGSFQMPNPGDWVLVCYLSFEMAFVISRLSSNTDKIPMETALDDDTCVGSKDGTQLHLYSDTGIRIGKKSYLLPPDEPLVLGNVLIALFNDLFDLLENTPIGLTTGPGSLIAPNPTFASQLEALRLQYLDLVVSNIVSKIAFTERG